jgi:pimeloyl-ACP methyl ester carboxylesterase
MALDLLYQSSGRSADLVSGIAPGKDDRGDIPTHGRLINGVIYQASGAGLHPTIVICHGLPGNEKNLDLAQAAQRAGWNAVTFNYRGSWGSPGNFRFSQDLEDGAAVLDYQRTPSTNAAALGIDTHKIVLAGHSMGGWVTAMTASKDPALAGAILISAADMGRTSRKRGFYASLFRVTMISSHAAVTNRRRLAPCHPSGRRAKGRS